MKSQKLFGGNPPDLPVPRYRQNPNKAECVPTCLKMVLDYLNQYKLRVPTQPLSVSEIASIIKTDSYGTELEDVRLLNDHPAITVAEPSVEFEAIEKPREIGDIESDFKKGLPPIAWVCLGKNPLSWKHAVVIVYINRSGRLVHLNDPTHGLMKEQDLGGFSEEWYAADRWLVRLILGRRQTKRLTDFVKRGVKSK